MPYLLERLNPESGRYDTSIVLPTVIGCFTYAQGVFKAESGVYAEPTFIEDHEPYVYFYTEVDENNSITWRFRPNN